MPGCCVEGCNNRSEKGYRLFRLPAGNKNSARRNEWLKLIGKNTLAERAVICEVHFGNDQFENNRKDGRKLLRPFAKPNLLKHKNTSDNEEENNSKKGKYSSDIKDVDSLFVDEYECNATSIYENSSCSNVNSDNTNNKMEVSRYTEATDMEVLRNTASNHKTYDEEYVTKLRKTLKKTVMQCNVLKRKLQEIDAKYEIVFNKDQRNFITCNTQKGTSWSADTITKALRLYVACGQKGYEEVRRQNLPYPSIRTLQHRIQLKHCDETICNKYKT